MQSNQNSFINLIAKDGFSVVFGRFYGAMDKASKSATNMGSSVRNAFASFAVGGAAYKATSTIVNLNLEFDRINRTLAFATRSTEEGAKAFAFIREESRRLGLDLKTTAATYAQFAAAARGTSLEGEKARDIFSAVSQAATVLGLDAYSTRGALRALEQMISKGNVQAEELRQQLGERLPGAFQYAAKAMGVTTAELNDMLENGEVLASDLLPRLTTVLNEAFGPNVEEAAESLRAEINRFRTETDLLINNIDKLTGFSAAFEGIVGAIASTEEAFNQFIEGMEAMGDAQVRQAPQKLREAIAQIREEIKELESAGGANFYELSFKYEELDGLNERLKVAIDRANELRGKGPKKIAPPMAPQGALSVTPMPESERLKALGKALDDAKTPQERYNEAVKQLAIVFGPDIIKYQEQYQRLIDAEAEKLHKTTQAYKDQEKEKSRVNQLEKDSINLIEDLMTEQDAYLAQIERFKEMHDRGFISLDQYAQAVREAGEAMPSFSDAVAEAQSVIESIMTPQQMYQAEVEKLSNLYSGGHLNLTQYVLALRALKEEVVDLLPETKAAADAQKELEGIFDSLKTPAEKYADQIIRIIELFKTLKDSNKDAFDALGGEEGMTALIMKAAEAQTAATTKLQEQADKASRMAMQNVAVVLNATSQQIDALSGAFEEGGKAAKVFFVMSQTLAAANAIISGLSAAMSIREAYAKLAAATANPTLATVGEVHANLAAVMGFATAGMIAGQTIASFEGGGYTGSGARVGGMDGKGGMLAMVHPNETIVDHEKNGKMAQPVHVNFNIQANDTKDFDRLLVERRGVIVSLINNAVNNRGRRLVE